MQLGGGFCSGDLTSEAEWCMTVRNKIGIIVVDVDYRLYPEFAFGKGAEDAWAALQWVLMMFVSCTGQVS
ncbi:uncharacterized protein N7473_008237 [Penicillium subrubescens]|uniref:Alpha/beta hydrolase fold-3 domain-containing protein n=1 Tax=Penicillium subrubescens TaxID=1316194 RepID=A0A1Q5TKI9_9EURO|nr:uncharacterized protein N7473_008237 [Penicillium subrubescens]KAJ5892009.1 hypothetical protein N7473_008237 [Penicillium subrubescens]OKP00748.1 hypothetical protein PENSUB_7679 [Penicillium subrubescens]